MLQKCFTYYTFVTLECGEYGTTVLGGVGMTDGNLCAEFVVAGDLIKRFTAWI